MQKRYHQIELFMQYPHQVQQEILFDLLDKLRSISLRLSIAKPPIPWVPSQMSPLESSHIVRMGYSWKTGDCCSELFKNSLEFKNVLFYPLSKNKELS